MIYVTSQMFLASVLGLMVSDVVWCSCCDEGNVVWDDILNYPQNSHLNDSFKLEY